MLSGAVAGLALAASGSPVVAGAAFAAGVVIDGDHAIDYTLYWIIHRRRLPFRELTSGELFVTWQRAGLLLHSYELLVPLWVIAWLTGAFALATWISISFVAHLVADQMVYPVKPLIYLFGFRAWRRFRFTEMVRQ